MRLTLRTLLAYRDGVLDAKDAEVLEAKIRDSSTAQQISQRITDEMKNRKLAPIPVDAREFGFEANMVAEFLDDTIPMETLPEMERKCLENNTLLSEIGSCHQILSRALSIPAPISSALRQRVHDLPNNPTAKVFPDPSGRIRRFDAGSSSAQSTAASGETGALSSAMAIPTNKTVRKSNGELRGSGIELNDGLGRQVPEYLIGNDRGWLKNAALGLFLMTALVVVGAIAVGPMDRLQELLKRSESAIAAPDEKLAETISKEKEPTVKPLSPKDESAIQGGSTDTDLSIAETSVAPPSPVSSGTNVPKTPEPSLQEGAKRTVPAIAESIAKPVAPIGNRIQWLPDSKESSEMIVLKLGAGEGDVAPAWRRMHAGEYATAGERIVVPPTQRTELRIEPGIRFLCAGENDLEQSRSDSVPSVNVRSGRFFVFATPDAKEVELKCNGLILSIGFASADGGCALEMQNEFKQIGGTTKSSELSSISILRLIGVQGEIAYSSKTSSGVESKGTLSVGQFLQWKGGESTGVSELAEEPWWFRTSVTRPIDQLAAKELQRALIGTESGAIDTELLDQISPNRKHGETVALAMRTRILFGRYDGLFEPNGVFNRGNLHIHWTSLLSQIPQSMGREEHRSALMEAIRAATPDRADTLFSLLVLPTQEQLAAGSDKLLVDSLSSSSLDERVLAFQQLNQITGKTLGYHPDKNQQEGIQQWRKLLSKNEIRYPETTTSQN